MNITQFLRILWARKILIASAAISCIIGGVLVMILLPPRWEAHARVMLNTIKPDPITGQIIGAEYHTYTETQSQLITDYSVAGSLPDQLGWLSDPGLIAAYQRGTKHSGEDFRHWAAQLIITNTRAQMLEPSNILDIKYMGQDPAQAKSVVDALRNSYIKVSLDLRRGDAQQNSRWYQDQAGKIRQELAAAHVAIADYERANGVFMADDKVDVDSAQLRALASQSLQATVPNLQPGVSPYAAQLSEIDTEIAQQAQRLGPNHPDLQALRARRQTIAELAAKEKSSISSAVNSAAANATSIARAVQAQKEKVMGKSDKIARVRELQADIDLKQEQYDKALAKAAELSQEANVADSGVTSLGPPTVGDTPAFPKKPLVLGGSAFLGLAVGVLSAILAEMMARRVRGIEELQSTVDVPVMAVIAEGRPGRVAANVRAQSGAGGKLARA